MKNLRNYLTEDSDNQTPIFKKELLTIKASIKDIEDLLKTLNYNDIYDSLTYIENSVKKLKKLC